MAEWTLMLYMNADHDDFNELARKNLDEIKVVGSTDQINIIALVDRQKTPLSLPNYAKPKIYRIEKDFDFDRTPALETLDTENMGDPATLTYFLNWCKTRFEAKKYLLTIWDHGGGIFVEGGLEKLLNSNKWNPGGWTNIDKDKIPAILYNIFRESPLKRRITAGMLPFPGAKQVQKNKQLFLDEIKEEPEEDFLYVKEISKCIRKVFGTIDVLMFDACWMQSLENTYTVRDTVQYLVASENTSAAEGFGYTPFIQSLARNPEGDAATAAYYMVHGTYKKYREESFLTISAVRPPESEEVGRLFKRLVGLLSEAAGIRIKKNQLLFQVMEHARFLCVSYYEENELVDLNMQLVDGLYFLEKLYVKTLEFAANDFYLDEKVVKNNEEKIKQLKAYCEDIAAAIDNITERCQQQLVASMANGAKIMARDSVVRCWGAQGFGLFFPETHVQWEEYKYNEDWYFDTKENRPDFPFDTKWKDLLDDFYKWQEKKGA